MSDFYSLFDRPAPRPEPTNVTPLDPARATRYATKALAAEVDSITTAAEGTRNHTLNTAAYSLGQLVGAGHLDEHTVIDHLTNAAHRAGLAASETEATIRSGLRAGRREPRIVPDQAPTDLPGVTVLEQTTEPAPDLTSDEEHDFWRSRDLLRHLHDFARARRVSPWAVLGVALARVITATPHQVCLPPIVGGKASLNLFVGLVGPSGSGKGAAEAVAAEALSVGYITSHNVGSGEGIAHGYKHRVKGELKWLDDDHAVLFSVPEIDSLAAQGDRRGATLMPQLRSGWTGEQLGFGYADPTKRLIIEAHEYRLCLVAGIQPGRAACLLDDADGGTPQRFLWLPATDPDAPDQAPREPKPWTWTAPPTSSLASIGGIKIHVCDTARTTITENRLARLRGEGDALDGHALLAQLKTAAALGIADGRYEVTDDDWALADVIARKSAATRAAVAHTLSAKAKAANEGRADAEATRAVRVDERREEAIVQRICRALVRKLRREGSWTSRTTLRQTLKAADRGLFDTAVERLAEAGQIEEQANARDAGGHGGKGISYRLIGES